jgi:hypothetical protein
MADVRQPGAGENRMGSHCSAEKRKAADRKKIAAVRG